MDSAYRKLLQEQDWQRIHRELLYFCSKLCRRAGRSANQNISKGATAEDIASKGIEAVISGQRKWEPERGDLIKFLKYGVVRSIMSNTHQAKENSLLVCLDCFYDDNQSLQEQLDRRDTRPKPPSAEELLITQEDGKRLLKEFKAIVSTWSNDQAIDVFDCMCNGFIKPVEIEALTGIPARRVSELKRQLVNKLRGIYDDYKK